MRKIQFENEISVYVTQNANTHRRKFSEKCEKKQQ